MNAGQVTIRCYHERDTAELYAAVRESVAELTPWMPWCHHDYAERDASNWIHATLEGHATGAMYAFAVFDATGRYAGGCGISQIRRAERVGNLGYWVRSSRAGQGIAPAAVLQVAAWAWSHTELNRLEIVAAIDNRRSQRVAEKVGARRERVVPERLTISDRPCAAVIYSLERAR